MHVISPPALGGVGPGCSSGFVLCCCSTFGGPGLVLSGDQAIGTKASRTDECCQADEDTLPELALTAEDSANTAGECVLE